ncbi:hypothetical protein RFI_03237 [Reticulomyxa filosa]|uniref:Uncharacterized protein n=1 Tax=Reticulomyxa filosa TaxID=46433 RepID=X6P6T6_RETFI|nr:hypothetical protein RFI_03237 [Reticulomyxa filosa]|eukprot:ETO33866.1 hypothetical protein RFI_03237 [Reticulomyxa filosa]
MRTQEIYYELQKVEMMTCFKHAVNMYFQDEYIGDGFVKQYTELLKRHSDEIKLLQEKEGVLAFYGDVPIESLPTKPSDFVPESNDIFHNEDLKGYYELIISVAISNEEKKNSLMHKNHNDNSNEEKYDYLEYIPHRLYHRYAHGQGLGIKEEKTDNETKSVIIQFDKHARKHEFESILRADPSIERVYFAYLTKKRAHAYCAIKLDTFEYNRIIHTLYVYILWLCFALHIIFYSASPTQSYFQYLIFLFSYGIFTLLCALDDLLPMLRAAVLTGKPNGLYDDGYWVLLDSLKSKPIYKGSLDDLFDETEMDGPCYASVMIAQDCGGKRLIKVL